MPYRSRRSTQIINPLSRIVCTQPARVTVSLRFFSDSSPLVCVRNIFLFDFLNLIFYKDNITLANDGYVREINALREPRPRPESPKTFFPSLSGGFYYYFQK